MVKTEKSCVQALAAELRYNISRTVDGISCHRVTYICHMDSYLMSPTRFKAQPYKCKLFKFFYCVIMCNRRTGIFVRHCHFLSVIRVSAYRCVYYALGLAQFSVNNRRIFTRQAVFFYLMCKRRMSHVIFCNK